MKILTAAQLRAWDAYTMAHEPVTFLELMERAAAQCLKWLDQRHYLPGTFVIFCGTGNNGGDGLALARMLCDRQCPVTVYLVNNGHPGSDGYEANLKRLRACPVQVILVDDTAHLMPVPIHAVIVDALFGSGLNRPPEGLVVPVIGFINTHAGTVISIDMPSGMFADDSSKGNVMVKATFTLTFQCYKSAFLLPENAPLFGDIQVLDIGLSAAFLQTLPCDWELVAPDLIQALYRPRNNFAHKGSYGHSLTIAGSFGKMGAAVLAAKACLRAGAGLHTCFLPACGYVIIQAGVPEAMALTDVNDQVISEVTANLQQYQAVGIGPGLGTAPETASMVFKVISGSKQPLVIDADALNILSTHPDWLRMLPANSIITPHPKEFERLAGVPANDMERLKTAQRKSAEWQVIIVLKGHRTFIALPDGRGFFNSTGNPGMATGGSGDVLTGILTGLLAQGYKPWDAALLGVYLHGLAGDAAAAAGSQESMIASDIIEGLGPAFRRLASGS